MYPYEVFLRVLQQSTHHDKRFFQVSLWMQLFLLSFLVAVCLFCHSGFFYSFFFVVSSFSFFVFFFLCFLFFFFCFLLFFSFFMVFVGWFLRFPFVSILVCFLLPFIWL